MFSNTPGSFRLESLTGKTYDWKTFKPLITNEFLAPSLIRELVCAYLRATDRTTQVRIIQLTITTYIAHSLMFEKNSLNNWLRMFLYAWRSLEYFQELLTFLNV